MEGCPDPAARRACQLALVVPAHAGPAHEPESLQTLLVPQGASTECLDNLRQGTAIAILGSLVSPKVYDAQSLAKNGPAAGLRESMRPHDDALHAQYTALPLP